MTKAKKTTPRGTYQRRKTATKTAAKPSQGKTTHVCFLLDRSGSMDSIRAKTISSVNEFIASLRQKIAGEATVLFTLRLFDSSGILKPYTATPVDKVNDLTAADYQPNAMTPLLDAIGRTVHEIDDAMAQADGRLFTVLTDGLENHSREYTKDSVKALIKDREAKDWTFTFMGTDFDVYGEAAKMGFAQGNTMAFVKTEIRAASSSNNVNATSYRTTVAAGLAGRGAGTTTTFYDESGLKSGLHRK